MADSRIPDLTFPAIRYSANETKWDLRPLLHRGGAGAFVRNVADQITKGNLGKPNRGRIPLVAKFHEHLAGKLAGGTRRTSIAGYIFALRKFYAWVDLNGRSATMQSIEDDYIEYSEYLLHRVRVAKDMSKLNAHNYASLLAAMLKDVLQLNIGLLARTRLTKPKAKKRVLGASADKQNLEQLGVFGHFLLDITDALSVEAIRGPLPVTIHFRSEQVLEEWGRLRVRGHVNSLNKKAARRRRAVSEAEGLSHRRYPLINLRMEAELLIFISQTGMNLAQANALKTGKFQYQSHLDGFRVYRIYKGRKGGEVEFNIYSGYRAVFERYLLWRNAISSAGDDRLFPFKCARGAAQHYLDFQAIRQRCKHLGVPCFRPQKLRNMRVNWLLRRSRDPNLTAEMSQHTKETLLRVYDQPHHQVAVAEITRFLAAADPAIAVAMPGPGICAGDAPRAVPESPPHASAPDCVSPAGCLFCDHQRDIDAEDHVWSLATYRHLKSLEIMQYHPFTNGTVDHPAKAAIDRISAKLKQIEGSSEVRALWVREALARVEEGHYHPKWDGYIQLMELRKWA